LNWLLQGRDNGIVIFVVMYVVVTFAMEIVEMQNFASLQQPDLNPRITDPGFFDWGPDLSG
jgi:hypothetical protein